MKIRALTVALSIALTVIAPAQARSSVPIVDPAPVTFTASSAPDAAAFKAALIKTGAASGWVLQGETANTYTMNLSVRNKHSVTVDVKTSDKGYSITYVGSANMNYAVKDGTRVIHPKYNQWVESFNRALLLELTKTGK